MSETNETADKPAKERKPLRLNRTVESGHVQQKFGQGRSKSVVVEKKRKRTVAAPAEREEAPQARPAATTAKSRARAGQAGGADRGGARSASKGQQAQGGLSKDEMAARAAALAAAHLRAADEERQAEQRRAEDAIAAEARAKEEAAKAEAEKKAKEAEAAEARAREAAGEPPAAPEADQAPEPAAEVAPEAETQADAGMPAPAARPRRGRDGDAATDSRASEPLLKPVGMTRPMIVTRNDRPEPRAPEPKNEVEPPRRTRPAAPAAEPARDDEDGRGKRKAGGKVARTAGRDGARVRGKLTITNAFDERQRERSLASLKRKREREKLKAMGISQTREKIMREVIIPEAITIQELANRMTERAVDVIKYLMKQGEMHKINDVIDADTAELIVTEFGHTPKRVSEADVEEGFFGADDDPGTDLQPRAPGRHHHGPRRPRQDVAARRDPRSQGRKRRGGWHHPAHRRLPGRDG